MRVPRSLFDRPMQALRKDAKLVKLRQGLPHHKSLKPQPLMSRPLIDQMPDQPEWLIHEDWALLQVHHTMLASKSACSCSTVLIALQSDLLISCNVCHKSNFDQKDNVYHNFRSISCNFLHEV